MRPDLRSTDIQTDKPFAPRQRLGSSTPVGLTAGSDGPAAGPAAGLTAGLVDIHCHCLPGLDDGPATIAQAVALGRALVADGVAVAVGTPHQLGRYDVLYDCDRIRSAVASLNAVFRQEGIELQVLPGADVRIDERIPDLLRADRIMTLADAGRHILLELPDESFIDPSPLLDALDDLGVTAILTHPERSAYLCGHPDVVMPWLRRGLALQINAGSLAGAFGKQAVKAANYWLKAGAVSLVASDAHGAEHRRPCLTGAMATIAKRFGYTTAKRLCLDNPYLAAGGKDLPAVACDRLRGRCA